MMITDTVRQFLLQEHIGQNDTLLCAVSGGADSVCMLHVLHALQQEAGYALSCVHVHHGIRGAEADEDAAFVRSLCELLQVSFVLKRVDVPALAGQSSHTGIEESARIARYEALREEAEKIPQTRIAVAHTMDDNAETVLFQLLRGTGLRGLAGIRPVNGRIIRPLLPVSRKDIEAYLTEHGLSWRTDETNGDVTYARNYIRNLLLPEAEKAVNTGAKEHVARAAGDVREMLRFVETQVAEAKERCLVTGMDEVHGEKDAFRNGCGAYPRKETANIRGAEVFSVKHLRKEDPFLRGELIRSSLAALQESAGKGAYYQIGRVHVEAVLRLIESTNGRAHLDLPGEVCVERRHDNLTVFLLP